DQLGEPAVLDGACSVGAHEPGVVAAGGNAQQPSHGRDRVLGLVRLHEPERRFGVDAVSSANQAAAFFRISRSSRSTRFSRRNRASSSRSELVSPSSRRPSSRSAWRTQLRIACEDGSNSRDNSSGVRPARTISTSCRRNSGGYGGFPFGIVDILPRGQVSTEPGQLQIVEGAAGSGKTTMLATAITAAEREGRSVRVVAPT